MKWVLFISLTVAAGVNAWLWLSNRSMAVDVASLQALTEPHALRETPLVEGKKRPLDLKALEATLESTTIDLRQARDLLDQASGLSEKERAVQEEAILMKLTMTDPHRAAQLALERGVTSALHFALRTWGERDPDAVLAWFENMDGLGKFTGPGAIDPLHETESALLEGISLNDLGRALEVMKKRDRAIGLHRIAIAYADQGRLLELRDSLNELEDGPIRREGMLALATVMAVAGEADAISTLENNFSEADRAHLAGLVMRSIPFHMMDNPGRVATWLNNNSDNSVRGDAMISFVSRWTQHDFNGVSTWLNDQQDQPWYDEVVADFVKRAVPADPRSGIDWAATISDTALRQQVLKEAVERSPEARAYLEMQSIAEEP